MIFRYANKISSSSGLRRSGLFDNLFIHITALPFLILINTDHTLFISQRSNPGTAFIAFETTEIKFGVARAGKKISGSFIVKNSGTDSLLIKTVQASDGGTIAYWPAAPIAPGVGDTIKVIFGFTTSRIGYQDKLFTVISKAQNEITVLHLKGIITKTRQRD
jgi:hypothetical protein